MKATSRVIVPFTPSLESALLGVSADVYQDDLRKLADNFRGHLAHISTVEKDGQTEGTLLYFCGQTPYDLFPHRFKKR